MADAAPDLSTLSDREVLLSGRSTIVAGNRVFAQRLAYLVEFFHRRASDVKARTAADPHFTLTPRQETVVEVGELWGVPEAHLRTLLNNALFLVEHLPGVWGLVVAGQLDDYRTKLVVEGARLNLDGEVEVARYDAEMTKFLTRHLRGVDGQPEQTEIVGCTTKQLRNRISYLRSKLQPAKTEEDHRKAMVARKTWTREDLHGMGSLSITNSLDKVQVAEKRLTLAAKEKQAAGDERTLDQLRADLALDLLAGKTEGIPTPSFARPVVNLTGPITTVMGLSDDPGVLSGGTVVPAGLARAIAADPDSTWYRMLTDPAGQMVELSTTSYQPTPAIWRAVVAGAGTCYRAGCDRPATECELDHREPFPTGPTSTGNLQAACKGDHKAKHAAGFGMEQTPDGSWVLLTPTGFRHPVTRYLQPTVNGFPDLPVTEEDLQFSVTEVADALAWLRHERDHTMLSETSLWEDDPDHPGLQDCEELRNLYDDLDPAA